LGKGFSRIRLRVGIALIFIAIMVPLTAVMTMVLYRQNVELAQDIARGAMERTSAEVAGGLRDLMAPMARMLDMSAAFAKENRGSLRKVESLRPMVESLDSLPEVFAIFLGFAEDGAFYEVLRVPAPGQPGLRNLHPPREARYTLRIKDKVGDELVDSYIYIAKWGDVVGVERAAGSTYDPRPRPWYKAAAAADGVVTSGVHVFSSIGRPCLSLSRRLATDDGATIGVFGADLATDTLSGILARLAVGKDGVVFILDEEGRLIGYPHAERALVQHDGSVEVAKAEQIGDRVTADAVRLHKSGMGDRFRAELGDEGKPYLVSFTAFPGEFGRGWTVGVIAAEDEFIAPLRRASVIILTAGFGVLVLASLAVVWASQAVTLPIQRLIGETARIEDLDLAEDVRVDSVVVEIHALASALARMKAALRSFAAYVPKDILRLIIDSGRGTAIGGVRQPVTVLFTDMAGFTNTSEFMTPEDLAFQLSLYLELLSDTIGSHGGTIDKYIGDAVMALWNAPRADPDHIAAACRGVLACRAALADFNDELVREQFPPMPTRFGLHTGIALVGNVGSVTRMQYTALGAAVNLASRIEGLNKIFLTTALVTAEIEQAVRGRFLFRPLGAVVPSGTSLPAQLFELVGNLDPAGPLPADTATRARCAVWEDAFGHYQARDWQRAAEAFDSYFRAYPDDMSCRVLLERCRAYAASPPPPEWDGALRFDEK
jgi:adenylate cyclase